MTGKVNVARGTNGGGGVVCSTGIVQRVNSFSAGDLGKSEAVCPSSPNPSRIKSICGVSPKKERSSFFGDTPQIRVQVRRRYGEYFLREWKRAARPAPCGSCCPRHRAERSVHHPKTDEPLPDSRSRKNQALRGAYVENAIQYFSQIPQRRKAGERLAPFHVERLDYRNQERDQFYKALERNGQKAVNEFRKAFPSG